MTNFDKKHHKLISFLRYVIIVVGFILMITMMVMLIQSAWIYMTNSEIASQIKAPPITPLIPYFTEIFGMESYFPPFYFIYFLVAIVIVSICHEFAHGILMKYSKTKIKSTGMMFLGPILGFFVEQDDKDFHKKKRIDQMATLGAGTFSNVLVSIIFYILYMGFFALAFQSSGYSFDTYALSVVNTSSIDAIYTGEQYATLSINGSNYFISNNSINSLNDSQLIYVYDDTPALHSNLSGSIVSIDNYTIKNQDSLSYVLSNYSPGDSVIIKTKYNSNINEYNITLAKSPINSSKAYLGIASYNLGKSSSKGFLSSLMSANLNKDDYDTRINEDVAYFIYYLLWWIMIINLLVALFNMLPWGMLDGGRFLELGIGKFTSEKTAKKVVTFTGKFIWTLLIFMMVFWMYRLF